MNLFAPNCLRKPNVYCHIPALLVKPSVFAFVFVRTKQELDQTCCRIIAPSFYWISGSQSPCHSPTAASLLPPWCSCCSVLESAVSSLWDEVLILAFVLLVPIFILCSALFSRF